MPKFEIYKEIQKFNKNSKEMTIKVGDITPEGLVVGAIYKDLATEQTDIVLTIAKHLADCVTWDEGQKLIDAFNAEATYTEKFGAFAYAHGHAESPKSHKKPDVLAMIYHNRHDIGGFEPTAENKNAALHGAAFNDAYTNLQTNKLKGGRQHSNRYDNHQAAVRAVAIVNAADIETKGITFMPRTEMVVVA